MHPGRAIATPALHHSARSTDGRVRVHARVQRAECQGHVRQRSYGGRSESLVARHAQSQRHHWTACRTAARRPLLFIARDDLDVQACSRSGHCSCLDLYVCIGRSFTGHTRTFDGQPSSRHFASALHLSLSFVCLGVLASIDRHLSLNDHFIIDELHPIIVVGLLSSFISTCFAVSFIIVGPGVSHLANPLVLPKPLALSSFVALSLVDIDCNTGPD